VSVVLASVLKRRKQRTVTGPQGCFEQPVWRQKLAFCPRETTRQPRFQGLLSKEKLGNELDLLVGDRNFKEKVGY